MTLPVAQAEPGVGRGASAKQVVASLVQAARVYSIYGSRHPVRAQALERLHENLKSALAAEGRIVLSVQRGKILCGDEAVYAEEPDEGYLILALYRDGVRGLTFLNGLELWETRTFLEILHKYGSLPEEPDGDLVTDLWEARLPHVEYEAVDSNFEVDADAAGWSIDQADPGPAGELHWEEAEEEGDEEDVDAVAPFPGALAIRLDPEALELTLEESALLDEMVVGEEKQDPSEAVFEVLKEILQNEEDWGFVGLIVEFFRQEVEEAFRKGHFDLVAKILSGFQQVRTALEGRDSRVVEAVDAVLDRISSPDCLWPLQEKGYLADPDCLGGIRRVLALLNPRALTTLCRMAEKAANLQSRKILVDAIRALAARDASPLAEVLLEASEDMCWMLAGVLGSLKGQRPFELLLGLVRRHPSQRVRQRALKAAMEGGFWDPKAFFPLVDDADPAVRKAVLAHLGSRRCETAENLLLQYLQKTSAGKREPARLLDCFRALACCGSGRAATFLQKILLGGSPISRFFGSQERFAAAVGLTLLGSEEAHQALSRAAGSAFPGVRRAARKAKDFEQHRLREEAP